MMVRTTVSEVAQFLNRPKSWIYNVREQGKTGLFDSKEVYNLIEKSFVSRSYDSYNYEAILNEKYKMLLLTTPLVGIKEKLQKETLSQVEFMELVIASKVAKKNMRMFNILSYLVKALGLSSNAKVGLKYLIFRKFVELIFPNRAYDKIGYVIPGKKDLNPVELALINDIADKEIFNDI